MHHTTCPMVIVKHPHPESLSQYASIVPKSMATPAATP